MEIWKDIPNYENYYKVSNFGRIKNVQRYVKTKGDGLRLVKEKIRKPQIKSNGYQIATLSKNNILKTFSVHQLVALAFIPKFTKSTELNHIDGNPSNNYLTNLEISNPSHNQLHAVRIGLRAKQGKSKYNNVTFLKNPKSIKKWAASIRHNNKSSYGWKTFMTEIEAAQYVDTLLDSIKDTSRNRNFP